MADFSLQLDAFDLPKIIEGVNTDEEFKECLIYSGIHPFLFFLLYQKVCGNLFLITVIYFLLLVVECYIGAFY